MAFTASGLISKSHQTYQWHSIWCCDQEISSVEYSEIHKELFKFNPRINGTTKKICFNFILSLGGRRPIPLELIHFIHKKMIIPLSLQIYIKTLNMDLFIFVINHRSARENDIQRRRTMSWCLMLTCRDFCEWTNFRWVRFESIGSCELNLTFINLKIFICVFWS